MKKDIQPQFEKTTITCACGNVLDVCSKCHPFWTGNLRKDTTGGRADKFKKKYGIE